MSTGMDEDSNRPVAEVFRDNWLWLVLLGVVLVSAGATAIVIPVISNIAASKVLGSVLVISGLVQVMQSARMKNGMGFIWHLLLGLLATVGGALIYMEPFAGVIALTLLIAIVIALHGATQIGFALKVRGQPGWFWFMIAGFVAFAVAALLMMKLPYTRSFTPATVVGASLLFAGWAYVAMALLARRAIGRR